MDEQWKAWVQENVQRGCSKEELFSILLNNGFDQDAALRELGFRPGVELSVIGESIPEHRLQVPNLRRVDAPLEVELFTAENFLAPRECRDLIEIMQGHLRTSTITVADEPDKLFRRSKTCDLSFIDHPAVRRLDSRICAAMNIDPGLAEPTQGQYYDVDDEFKPHTDYFEAYELEKFCTPAWGQRSWTFMMYLNEPEGGGETAFTHLGFSIRPKTGRAVIWNSLHPDGRPNPNTMHHGMPVTGGCKSIITKWFRQPRGTA
jgi:prolyl 4-hydroxylase